MIHCGFICGIYSHALRCKLKIRNFNLKTKFKSKVVTQIGFEKIVWNNFVLKQIKVLIKSFSILIKACLHFFDSADIYIVFV